MALRKLSGTRIHMHLSTPRALHRARAVAIVCARGRVPSAVKQFLPGAGAALLTHSSVSKSASLPSVDFLHSSLLGQTGDAWKAMPTKSPAVTYCNQPRLQSRARERRRLDPRPSLLVTLRYGIPQYFQQGCSLHPI